MMQLDSNKAAKKLADKKKEQQKGFTLLEVMVVLVIIGLLVAIVAPNVLDRQDEAMVQKARLDLRALENGLNMYHLDHSTYPTTAQGLDALVKKPSIAPEPRNYPAYGYLRPSRLPTDPWGNAYQYRFPGEKGRIDVFSFGADGRLGGEGLNADIGNWDL